MITFKRLFSFSLVLFMLCVPMLTSASASNIPDGLTDDEILELIISGNGYYLGEGIPVDEFYGTTDQPSTRWTSGLNQTHQYITGYGFSILSKDKSYVYDWYTSLSSMAVSTVTEYSDWPDEHERVSPSGVLRHHFYYVDEGESGNYHAGSYFVNHYNDAVSYYNSGNTTEALRSLGKALHYLEDASTPVHTASYMYGLVSPISHSSYESTVNSNLSNFSASSTTLYNSYSQMSLSSIVPDVATYAYSQLPQEPFTTDSILSSASNAVPRAMRNVAAILYRFYVDTL